MAIKQDALVALASKLTSELKKPVIQRIDNRIAYIVSHGASYASNGYAVRTQGIAHALNESGFETLCMVRPGRPWELSDIAINAEVTVRGVRYIHSGKDKSFINSKAEEHLESSVEYFRELLYVYRPAYVIAASDFKIGLPALVAAKQLGIPFFNEVRGFWEMSRVAREPGYEKTNAYKRQIERDTYVAEHAEAVFTLSSTMKDELTGRGIDQQKIHLLPNGVSELPKLKIRNSELQKKLGIKKGEKVIGFIGSINEYEGLDTLVSACQQLVDAGKNIKLLVVGDSQPLNNILGQGLDIDKKEDLPWIVQVGRVSHDEVGDYYSLVDAIVIPRKKLPVCETVPPMKAAEALAYGKPLIVSNVKAMRDYVEQYDSVQDFDADNSTALANEIDKLSIRSNTKPNEISIKDNINSLVKVLNDKDSLEGLVKKENSKLSRQINQTGCVRECSSDEKSNMLSNGELLAVNSEFDLPKKEPVWHKINVKPGQIITISAATTYLGTRQNNNRKAVLLFNSLDGNSKLADKAFGKLARSGHLKAYFKYLPCTGGSIRDMHVAEVPPGIFELMIGFCGFNQSADERVLLNQLKITATTDIAGETKFIPPSKESAEISLLGWPELKKNDKPVVLGIMDEFTSGCFESDVNLLQPRPDNWYALAEKYSPELIFIESAWKGNFASWQYRVADYANKPGQEISHICQYAREKGIPTLFWNKEDPVHHQKFMCSAKLVDHIFTTDANMKPSYEEKTGNESVYALPFAAQPSLHKPAPLKGRKSLSCFAGSWYGNRHAERGDAMKWLLQAANKHGLEIYDRNYGTGIFPFPEEYQKGIKGSVPYKQLCGEYSRYRVFLNVNSVTDSPTMFSRRVFELMACGTPVVSTYAKGIESLFDSDAVWLVNSPEEADEAFNTLMHDDAEWRKRSLAGIREVFAKHTYAHRLNDIFESIGIETRMPVSPHIAILASVKDEKEFSLITNFANEQSYSEFQIYITCPSNVTDSIGSCPANIQLVDAGEEKALLQKLKDSVTLVGRVAPGTKYGVHYLRDLVNATIYQPNASGWSKSATDDIFQFQSNAELYGSIWDISHFIKNFDQKKMYTSADNDVIYTIDSDQYVPSEQLMNGGKL